MLLYLVKYEATRENVGFTRVYWIGKVKAYPWHAHLQCIIIIIIIIIIIDCVISV